MCRDGRCARGTFVGPLAYEHVAELIGERGVAVDDSCIWRWVQAYAPELDKRCRPYLKPTNKSYRTDETHVKVKGQDKYLYRAVDSTGQTIELLLTAKRDAAAANRFFRKALSSPGNPVPRVINVDNNRAFPAAVDALKGGRRVARTGSSTPMQISQRCGGAGPSHGEEANLACQGLWLFTHGVANVAKESKRCK